MRSMSVDGSQLYSSTSNIRHTGLNKPFSFSAALYPAKGTLCKGSFILRILQLVLSLIEDPRSRPEGKIMLTILEHLLREFSVTGLEIPHGNDVAETLLAASRFGTLEKRLYLLSLAIKSIKDIYNIPLQATIVRRQSVLLRLKGDIPGSKYRIQDFITWSTSHLDLSSNLVLGLLQLSQATNYTYEFNFRQAHEEARKWMPRSMEKYIDLVWDQVHVVGRAFKGEGQFGEARHCFERCLEVDQISEAKRFLIKSHLADVYSELDYLQRENPSKERYLDNAAKLLIPEIELLRSRNRPSKGYRRLLLAFIEIEIRRDRLDNAGLLIAEILSIYKNLTEIDIVDRLGHVRALIARARISPLPEAEYRWSDALKWNRKYNPLEEEVFTCALIYLFICSTRFRLGDVSGAKAAHKLAEKVMLNRTRQYLIPGVGTYLLDSVWLQVESVRDLLLSGLEFG